MANILISQLLYLFDDAFQGPDWHSLVSNLKNITPDDWLWVAPGGRRSICEIVQHAGSCKWMYQNQAFGDALRKWDDPLINGQEAVRSIPSALDWLRAAHANLRQSIATLDDSELLVLRGHHSGKPRETRWIITTMMQHDLYHAGEINYIRALHQQNDE